MSDGPVVPAKSNLMERNLSWSNLQRATEAAFQQRRSKAGEIMVYHKDERVRVVVSLAPSAGTKEMAMDVPLQADSPAIDTRTPHERREGFERAEASLALEGLYPSGPVYERVRAAVIAGRMTSDQAAAEISASFGPDVE